MAEVATVIPILVWPGKTKWQCDTNLFTTHITRNIVPQIVGEVRAQKSKLLKFPMTIDETTGKCESWDAWSIRIAEEEGGEDTLRRAGETAEEHVVRINRPKTEAQDMALIVLNRLGAEILSQPELSQEEYDSMKWLTVKNFLYNVLLQADLDVAEYAPKKPTR